MNSLLIVEDDQHFLKALTRFLSEDFEVIGVNSMVEAWKILKKKKVDLVVVDWWLPDGIGLNLLYELRIIFPHIRRYLMTATHIEEAKTLADPPFEQLFIKPIKFKEIKETLLCKIKR
jgi:DNA-binding NtrC family response regulator